VTSVSVLCDNFSGEWWNTDANTKVSAKDQDALCQSLLWTYIDDEDLIKDEPVRNRLLRLHFQLCSLVREVTFPQWYTETEFSQLEEDFTFVAVEFNWLQDLLESHGQLPGVGFNIIKFHDFLSIPSIMREIGCIMNADTSTMEMRMKEIKHHDKFVKKSRRDKGHGKVFLRAVAQDIDDAYQAWRDAKASATFADDALSASGEAPDASVCTGTEFSDSSNSSEEEEDLQNAYVQAAASKRKMGTWSETRYILERGVNGPSLDTRLAFFDFPEGQDIRDGVTKFHMREQFLHEDPTTLKKSNMYLLPGHCVQLQYGKYAQVILPHVHDSEVYGYSGPTSLLSMFEFVDSSVHSGNHAVIPVPFLERGRTVFTPLSHLLRRVHVYPKWRPGVHNTPSVPFNVQFFVNPFVFKVRRGLPHPLVCVSCPDIGCCGRAPKPRPPERYATCDSCDCRFLWF